MSKIIAYISFFFLSLNIVFSIKGAIPLANSLFYPTMLISFIVILFSATILKKVVLNKGFQLFFYLNLINLIYFLLLDFGDLESLQYLLARFCQFSIFSISIFLLNNNFSNQFIRFLKVLTVLSLVASVSFNFPDFSSRYMGIFFNPNEFAVIMVVGFSLFLFDTKKTTLNYILIIAFFILILLSASRSAFIGVVISLILYFMHQKTSHFFKISIFLLLPSIIFLFFSEINPLSRFFEQSLFYNRQLEYLYAFETFLQKPMFGYGLKNYAFIDETLIDFDRPIDFGAHNGYLSILVQYGMIFSCAFFFLLLWSFFRVFRFNFSLIGLDQFQVIFFKFILIFTLFNGLTENTFVGINYFQSNLFWISLAYLLFKIYENENSSISD